MKILVTGGRGQLGRTLAARSAHVIALGSHELDVTAPRVIAAVLDAHAPDAVIQAAGFTAVDRAETERAAAFAINADGADNVARACAERGVAHVYVSTDYVFDGTATRPYREQDAVAPRNVYGESKAHGEQHVLSHGGSVVRTSWLFAERGPSFVQTIVRLAKEQPVLRVVADQHGCPTWAGHLADALLAFVTKRPPVGIYHACDHDPTTWHGFATAIVDEARAFRELACVRVQPITTADYPTPARRPAYSVLDPSKLHAQGIAMGAWRDGLRRVLAAELGGA